MVCVPCINFILVTYYVELSLFVYFIISATCQNHALLAKIGFYFIIQQKRIFGFHFIYLRLGVSVNAVLLKLTYTKSHNRENSS